MSRNILHFVFSFLTAALLLLGTKALNAQDENLNVFDRWISWSDGGRMLIRHLNRQAFELLDARDESIASLGTREDWIGRRETVRQNLFCIAGPFPEKTPLNARVTGSLRKEGYQVEKIVYESMPGFYVTSCLFIPDQLEEKNPAIIHVSGHSAEAFRSTPYQILILNLVRKGFIVFAIDPVGQGERLQYPDSPGRAPAGSGEHSYVGNQCFIAGASLARYFIWDIIRGVDYLVTRPEVDPKRIGIAGRSGGGTQSAYAMAFDERISAAAPESYITGFRRLLESIGAQDAEQIFFHSLLYGITHADLIEVRAPKPTLIVALTRDYFSIQGARETFEEARRAYEAMDSPGSLRMAEDDNIHMSTPANREEVYRFFQEALHKPGSPKDDSISIIAPVELKITEAGQVLSSMGGETVFSLNKKEAEERLKVLGESRKDIGRHSKAVLGEAKRLSGFIAPSEERHAVFRGRYQREGYEIELYGLRGEGDYVIPLLLCIPDGISDAPSIVYLHPEGKSHDAGKGERIERLVRAGFIVAAVDPLGIGETADSSGAYVYAAEYEAILIGRSIPGIQAGDIIRVVDFLKSRKDTDTGRIGAVAYGAAGPALLHAAAFDTSIQKIALINTPLSYSSIVLNRFYAVPFECAVAGALLAYDLPDLAACLAPRKLLLVSPFNHLMEPAAGPTIETELAFPLSVYESAGYSRNFRIMEDFSDERMDEITNWWNAE